MDIVVTEAEPEDAAAIAAVQVAGVHAAYSGVIPDDLLSAGDLAFRTRQWRGWIERSQTSTFVTRDNDELTGFCTLHPAAEQGADGPVVEVAAIYVLPTHWRRGLGRVLCERALAEAQARGFAEVVLWELDSNERGRRFYDALGFRRDGVTRVFIERPDAVVHEERYRIVTRAAPGRPGG